LALKTQIFPTPQDFSILANIWDTNQKMYAEWFGMLSNIETNKIFAMFMQNITLKHPSYKVLQANIDSFTDKTQKIPRNWEIYEKHLKGISYSTMLNERTPNGKRKYPNLNSIGSFATIVFNIRKDLEKASFDEYIQFFQKELEAQYFSVKLHKHDQQSFFECRKSAKSPITLHYGYLANFKFYILFPYLRISPMVEFARKLYAQTQHTANNFVQIYNNYNSKKYFFKVGMKKYSLKQKFKIQISEGK
jgi:hypothetical protein